jgi:hypothetical protein
MGNCHVQISRPFRRCWKLVNKNEAQNYADSAALAAALKLDGAGNYTRVRVYR